MIPIEVKIREEAAGTFTAELAKRLPFPVKETVFCGPSSFRDPETDNCWHPYMIRRGVVGFIRDQIPLFLRATGGGIRRFIKGCFGRFHYVENVDSIVLGVSPTNICQIKDGKVRTSYCHQEDGESMAWLLIDDSGKERDGYPVSRYKVLLWLLRMLGHWSYVTCFRRKKNSCGDWLVASVLTLRWILSLLWVNRWMLALVLEKTLKDSSFRKVFCVHEMHPQARIACAVSRRMGVTFRVIQHASINRSKLWYFPVDYELSSGLESPDEFVVFSPETAGLLNPYYSTNTVFSLGCSNRYVHWKTKSAECYGKNNVGSVLFVSSLSWWDNVVILEGISMLLVEAYNRRMIRVRLHPHAHIPSSFRTWFDSQVASGKIYRSTDSLENDLATSALVVGMTTTVLEEASLLAKPVITLTSSKYLSSGEVKGSTCNVRLFSAKFVEQAVKQGEMDDLQMSTYASRRLLGLEQPVARI